MPDDDSSAPVEVDTPNDPNMPADSPFAPAMKEAQQSQEDEYNKQQQDLVKQVHDEHQRYQSQMQPFIDHFQQQMQSPADPPPQQSQMQLPQDQKNNAAQAVGSLVAAAAIAFTVFGRKGAGSPGAMMSGLGSLMSGYAQGKKDKVHEDSVKFHQMWELKQKENSERLQNYRETLANKRLDLSQQMDLIKMRAAQHHDFELEAAAEQKNLNAVVKNLESKRKANQAQVGKLIGQNAKDYKSGPSAEWRALVLEKSEGKIDPARSDDEREQAYKLYPFSQFLKDRKTKPGKKTQQTDNDPLGLGLKGAAE